jgi:hypothetical protein
MPLKPLNHSDNQHITHISWNPTIHYHDHKTQSFIPTQGSWITQLINKKHKYQIFTIFKIQRIHKKHFKNLLSFNSDVQLDINNVFNLLCFELNRWLFTAQLIYFEKYTLQFNWIGFTISIIFYKNINDKSFF